MPTIFTHPAIAIGLSPWFRDAKSTKIVILIGIIFTVLPDIDVIAFRLGIPYAHMFGHRGFSHSLFFAALFSALTAWPLSKWLYTRAISVWLYLFLCMASHGILDMLTNGGLGIALLSPFSNERFFFPLQPIEVSTLSIRRFFDGQGIPVIISELKWVWLPSMVVFSLGLMLTRLSSNR
jgi:inner membrane protein